MRLSRKFGEPSARYVTLSNCGFKMQLTCSTGTGPGRYKTFCWLSYIEMFFFPLLFQHVLKVDVLKLNPADSPKTSKKPTLDVLEKSKVFRNETDSPTVDDIDSPRVHKKSKGDAINTASVLKKPSVEHTESLKKNFPVNEADIKPVNQLQRPGLKVWYTRLSIFLAPNLNLYYFSVSYALILRFCKQFFLIG